MVPLQVPPTMRFNLDGQLPPYLLAKDLILHIIGEISVSGVNSICATASGWQAYLRHLVDAVRSCVACSSGARSC